jgi:DNA polymerase-3 subunit gamma/tau
VLATTDPQKIPVTVLSRCLQFNLKQIPRQQIEQQLGRIAEAESVPAEPAALALIARSAQGSLRDALSLLDQALAHGGGKVDAAATRAMLGTVDQTYLHTILRALAAGDGAALIAEADRMFERSLSFETALQDLGTLLHRLALAQVVPGTLGADDPDSAPLRELAALFSPDELQLYYQIAVQGRSEIGLAPDEYAGFTMALLRMLAFAPASADTSAAGERAARVSRSPAAPVSSAPAGGAPAQNRSNASRPAVGGAKSASAEPQTARTEPKASPNAAPASPSQESIVWGDLVERLGIGGMARMLAQHCELAQLTEARVELTLPKTHERLLDKPYQERLRGALQKHFGRPLQLSIVVGEGNGNSPVAIAERERQRLQAAAIAEIEQDAFVRELVENFDAKVNEASIKPLGTSE